MKVKDVLKNINERITRKKTTNSLTVSERDKKLLIFGVFFALLVIMLLIYQSYSKKIYIYEKQVVALREQLAKTRALSRDYKDSKRRLDIATSSLRKEEEALISVMEKILVESGVGKENFSIKDSGKERSKSEGLYEAISVEVDIRRISLPTMIDVLYKIQSRNSFLKVSDLRMRTKFDNPAFLDASFRLSTFELNKTI